ncbi:MAG: acylneuraminate cytidylyltransferase family protein [Anaerolineales bacterium]|jgi:N-acylneuraminate cytidylyltransferase
MIKPETIAIIPARGGSKGIPRKNIRLFAGHPLIAYSIAAALQADGITRVIVTTDDEEIADVARRYGAETPFLRPVELAGDHTTDLPVFQHAIFWMAEHEKYHPDIVIHLHPTSPVRPRNCLDQGIRLLVDHPEAECVRSVLEPSQSPFKMWRIDEHTGHMIPLVTLPGITEPYNIPRQNLPLAYVQTGHTNAIRTATIQRGSMTGHIILPLVVDGQYEVDLDTLEDWQYGEWVVANRKLEMVWPEEKNNPNKAIRKT